MKKTVLGILISSSLILSGCGNDAGSRITNPANSVDAVLQQGMEAEQNAADNGSAASGGAVVATPDPVAEQKLAEAQSEPPQEDDGQDGAGEGFVLSATEGIDVDLTMLSSTMVYSEVYDMMYFPENYVGRVIRMNGMFTVYHDDATGKDYYACIVMDATACCAQGMEFELKDGYTYPEPGEDITVIGTFDTYMEGEYMYAILRDAILQDT